MQGPTRWSVAREHRATGVWWGTRRQQRALKLVLSEHPSLVPVERRVTLADEVADRILKAVIDHVWEPGDRLPSELALADQLHVSRTVIREALRTLAGKGVLAASSGRGTRVAAASESSLRDAMRLFLRSRARWHYLEVHEVRAMFEVQIAGLAADRASDDEVERLAGICDRMSEALTDTEAASQFDLEFHRVIALSTHNTLCRVMLDAISEALLEIRLDTFGPQGRAREALESHREILGRIRDNDAEGARVAMARHLDEVADYWQKSPALQGAGSKGARLGTL